MSLLKVNEVQNYNGSSLTLTASTVSTSAQLNTGGNISVTGSINVSDDSTTRSNLGLGSIATQDSDNVTVTGGTATLGALTVSGSDSGDLVRITQTGSGNALVVEDSANPDSTPFVVDATGNVGIGTGSPSYKLNTVIGAGESNGVGFLNSSGQGLNFYTDTTASSADVFMDLGQSGASLIFNQAGSEKMRITSSGGLKTSGTTAEFISASNNISIQSNRTSGTVFSAITVRGNSGSDLNLIIWNNGNVVNANNSYGAISDEKLKENIIDATPKLEDLCKVRVVNYNLKTDPEHKHLGVIAQELENVFPNMIDNSTDYDADGNDLGTTTKSVKYSVFTSMLIKATQEQQALIESQQSQIDALTARIEALETA